MRVRRQFVKEGKVGKHEKKDIDHRDGNPLNNKRSNLHVMSVHANRAKH